MTHHVIDSGLGQEFDEVREQDSGGKFLSAIRLDSNGKVQNAVRLDRPTPTSSAIGRARALLVADRVRSVLGLRCTGDPFDEAPDYSGGWAFGWHRTVNGIPVRGDGTQVRMLPDGTVWAVTETYHSLAVTPASMLTADEAKAAVARELATASNRAELDVTTPDLMWVLPNNLMKSDAADLRTDSVAHLAWAVPVHTSGQTAESMRLLVFFIDAGDGTVIGGDSIT